MTTESSNTVILPCKVLHFRNVHTEISQVYYFALTVFTKFLGKEDINNVCSPFGTVDKVVMMKTKKQAMVQFHEVASAMAFVAHHSTSPIKIGYEFIALTRK